MPRRKPISRPRTSASLQRRAGRTPPRSVTLIVCEGETEEKYITAVRAAYRLTNMQVVVVSSTTGSAPISVVECAAARWESQGGYDHVWCVFDRDGHESFKRARDKIRGLAERARNRIPIEEAVSIPCFELWILLHFQRTDAPFGCCDDVIHRIRSHIPHYIKADDRIAQELVDRVDVAIAHALWLEERQMDNDENPSTSVHKLLKHFQTLADC